jgi:CRISPR/Cas system CSM-associated protein Csm2 small subunit
MAKNKKYPEAMEYAQSILGMNKHSSQEDIGDTDDGDEDDAGELFKESLSFSAFDKDLQEEIREAVREDIYDIICYENGVVKEKSRQKALKWITQNLYFGYNRKLILNEELNNLFDSILKEIMDDLEKEDAGDLE